jgi:hypothetical protein
MCLFSCRIDVLSLDLGAMGQQTTNETRTGGAEDVSSILPAHPSTKQATYALTDVLMPNVCPVQREYTHYARKCTECTPVCTPCTCKVRVRYGTVRRKSFPSARIGQALIMRKILSQMWGH